MGHKRYILPFFLKKFCFQGVRTLRWCRRRESNPHARRALPPQDSASAYSATSAQNRIVRKYHAKRQISSAKFAKPPCVGEKKRHYFSRLYDPQITGQTGRFGKTPYAPSPAVFRTDHKRHRMPTVRLHRRGGRVVTRNSKNI